MCCGAAAVDWLLLLLLWQRGRALLLVGCCCCGRPVSVVLRRLLALTLTPPPLSPLVLVLLLFLRSEGPGLTLCPSTVCMIPQPDLNSQCSVLSGLCKIESRFGELYFVQRALPVAAPGAEIAKGRYRLR